MGPRNGEWNMSESDFENEAKNQDRAKYSGHEPIAGNVVEPAAVGELAVLEPMYTIDSRIDLPLRMRGPFSYGMAYALVCAWNMIHRVEDMAWMEPVEEAPCNS